MSSDELKKTYLALARAELLITDLEKLKAEVSSTEARCRALDVDFTNICDEAIVRLHEIRASLERDLNGKTLKADLETLKVASPRKSNLEARIKLGLAPPEERKKAAVPKSDAKPATNAVQAVIDKMADGIELGLDKVGDGIMITGSKIAGACMTLFKAKQS